MIMTFDSLQGDSFGSAKEKLAFSDFLNKVDSKSSAFTSKPLYVAERTLRQVPSSVKALKYDVYCSLFECLLYYFS